MEQAQESLEQALHSHSLSMAWGALSLPPQTLRPLATWLVGLVVGEARWEVGEGDVECLEGALSTLQVSEGRVIR